MLENIRGDSRGSIPPLRMPSPLPHDLCHEWNVSCRLLADLVQDVSVGNTKPTSSHRLIGAKPVSFQRKTSLWKKPPKQKQSDTSTLGKWEGKHPEVGRRGRRHLPPTPPVAQRLTAMRELKSQSFSPGSQLLRPVSERWAPSVWVWRLTRGARWTEEWLSQAVCWVPPQGPAQGQPPEQGPVVLLTV